MAIRRILLFVFICVTCLGIGTTVLAEESGNKIKIKTESFPVEIVVTDREGRQSPGQLNAKITERVVEGDYEGKKLPVIIFSHGWIASHTQFDKQAELFARNGYIVITYDVRGWHKSDGEVDMFGQNTIGDLSLIIDELQKRQERLNRGIGQIGVAGISQGGAISFLGAAHDYRIKAAAMLSMGMDVKEAFYGGNTPRTGWMNILLDLGSFTGRLSNDVKQVINDIKKNQNMEMVDEFIEKRSPKNDIEFINGGRLPVDDSNVPILLSYNLQDNLYWSNHGLKHFFQIESPYKRMLLNKGGHATPEHSDELWEDVLTWFDCCLKVEDKNKDSAQSCQFQPIQMRIDGYDTPLYFDDWPQNPNIASPIQEKTYYLRPRKIFGHGSMSSEKRSSSQINTIATNDLVGLSGLATPSPLFSQQIEVQFHWVNKMAAMTYLSSPSDKDRIMAGIPKLEMSIEPSSSEAQIIAHLYDVDPNGVGKLISYAPLTLHDVVPGETIRVSLDLAAVGHLLKKGHNLGLGIDTDDCNYAKAKKFRYFVKFHYDNPPQLTIPFVKENY